LAGAKVGAYPWLISCFVFAPALCQNLASPLLGLLNAMRVHTRHFGRTPNFVALNPGHFLNSRNQRVARFNCQIALVLLTNRSQFLYKVSILAEMVEELGQSFESAVETLAEGLTPRPDRCWDIPDAAHHDLNTCLRESLVILKCFLHALPEEQLADFQGFLKENLVVSPASGILPIDGWLRSRDNSLTLRAGIAHATYRGVAPSIADYVCRNRHRRDNSWRYPAHQKYQ
jgi:hypothetical protein